MRRVTSGLEPAQVLLDPAVPLHQVVALPLQAVLPLFRIGDEGFASATFLCNAGAGAGPRRWHTGSHDRRRNCCNCLTEHCCSRSRRKTKRVRRVRRRRPASRLREKPRVSWFQTEMRLRLGGSSRLFSTDGGCHLGGAAEPRPA